MSTKNYPLKISLEGKDFNEFIKLTFCFVCKGSFGGVCFLIIIQENEEGFLKENFSIVYIGEDFSCLKKQKVVLTRNFFTEKIGEGIGCFGGFILIKIPNSGQHYSLSWIAWSSGVCVSFKGRKLNVNSREFSSAICVSFID